MEDEQRKINNDVDLIFETDEYPDELYSEVLDNMYLPLDESYNGQRTWDVSQFEFEYSYMDIQRAANDRSTYHVQTSLEKKPSKCIQTRPYGSETLSILTTNQCTTTTFGTKLTATIL